MRAGSFARKLSFLSRSRQLDDDDLPAYDPAPLFDEGAAALERLEGQLTSITIHGTDELPHDWRIAHPLMSVHVVNGHTGRHLLKSAPERPAVTPHERLGASEAPLSHILPILTKPFPLRGASARLPKWEEELVLGEAFTYLLHPRVFLLFELLDFAPDQPEGAGLTPYAWGFLKVLSGPMGAPSHSNLLRQMPLRLQLYRWQKRIKPSPGQPAVWAQYLAAGRRPYGYSSTAVVTVRPLPPPEKLAVRFPHRPMAPHHIEEGRISYERMQQEALSRAAERSLPTEPGGVAPTLVSPGTTAESAQWFAATAPRGNKPCQLPNTLLHALPGGDLGATAIALSPDGALVAIGLADQDVAMIVVHEVQSGRPREAMHAHHRTIHELCWSANGERLVSVSADGTAKVWPIGRAADDEPPHDDEPLATLTHPSYVYCVRAQPKPAVATRTPTASLGGAASGPSPSLLVTGANDNALRLWDVSGAEPTLLATKTHHKARVNAVAWPTEASIFSADGAGVVKHWEVEGRLGGGAGADLKLITSIEKKELRDVPINSVTLHPNRRRLLLQTRNHQLLALDTRLQHFPARYQGHRVGEYHVRATYSPDGRLVVAGSEDGRFFAWAEESGSLLIDGLNVGFSGPLLQISWSSMHDTVAMCGFGADNPALLYFCDPTAQNPLLAAAATAVATTAANAAATNTGGQGLVPSADGLPLAAAPATERAALSATAAERAQQRQSRRNARRANLDTLGGSVASAGTESYPSALAGTEDEQTSRRKAAARARRQTADLNEP